MIADAAYDGSGKPATRKLELPRWMNERRQRCLFKLLRFAWGRPYGRLCLTDESTPRACRDAGLLPHEFDRAIDDLSALGGCEVRGDGLTDYVTFRVNDRDIAWRACPPVG